MLIYLTSRIVSCVAAFLYPGYASFKTLSQRPASEQDLERWLMYWSVLACVIGVEYLAEWLVSWIPFYYFFKMLFLLYIALPQTQGASYLYQTQLAPALRAHESQIDAALAQLRMRVFAFVQARARMLWDYIIASATGPAAGSSSTTGAASSSSSTTGGGGASAQQGPPLSDSVSGPTQMLGTLWRTYGPAIVAGGTALLQQQRSGAPPPPPPTRGYDVDGGASDGSSSIQMMPPSQSRTSSAESASGLRGRVGSGTNFEEVEVPSDAESERAGGGMRAPAPRRATSGGWFGWGSGAHEKAD